jgi:molybdopterin-guanine dinucleotide biosynthesis protein A
VSWLVMACDLPNVDDRTIEILIAARADAGGQPFIAYRSSHDGLPEPLCSVYGPGSRKIIDAFIADGISCPRKIMIRSATLLLEQATPDSLDNMNRPEDLDGTGVRVAR